MTRTHKRVSDGKWIAGERVYKIGNLYLDTPDGRWLVYEWDFYPIDD